MTISAAALMAAGQIQDGRVAAAQGKIQERLHDYNARISDYNARVNRMNAAVAEESGRRKARSILEAAKLEEGRVSRKEKAFKAMQRAKFAKSGVSLSEGSPLDVMADTSYEFMQDRLLTLRSGFLQSREAEFEGLQTGVNFRNQARNYTMQGIMQRAMGDSAREAGQAAKRLSYFKAGTTMALAAFSSPSPSDGQGDQTWSGNTYNTGYQSPGF